MKRQNPTHPRGVALLLILGLMAMFALAILSYLMVTSNMAETAQNAQKVEQKKSLEVNPEHDIDHALKTLVIGSTNQSNPIAPLSILENMYGNWSESKYNNDGTWGSFHDATFVARVMLLPSRGFALVVPTEDYYGNALGGNLSALRDFYKSIFEDSGNVLTFTSIDDEGSLDDHDVNLWNTCVTGSSAFIDEKVITDPVKVAYKDETPNLYCFDTYAPNGADGFEIIAGGDYGDFDYWHFKVDITDEMKRFASNCNNSLADFNNDASFLVTVRLNHPAYSGSGVGGFSPGELKDSSFTPDQIAAVPKFAGLTIPFAYWTNPSAPDFMPFVLDSNSKPSFRSFWAHLTDVNYRVDFTNRYAQLNGAQWSYNNYVTDGNSAGDPLFQTRINPAYTAPDYRSLFLAHFDGVMAPNSITPNPPYAMITPSFHRPQLFAAYMNHLGDYAGSGYNDQKFSALIRKLTPRPLPNDHWHFDGGNSALSVYEMNGNYSQPNYQDVVERLAGTDAGGNQMQWDVDNDGDGVREGIWVPTGLPIRYDANGTPFATLASYTIVDLDGRINVNTAGNWDQLPNKLATENRQDSDGNVYSSSARPYDNLNELVDVINATGSSLVGTPFFNVENLQDPYSIFNWLNEKNVYESGMIRGDGLGASNVRLYDVLLWIFTTESDNQVAVTASNLLWRRYLPTNQDPYLYTLTQDTINGGNTYNLSWDQNGIYDAIRSGAPSDVEIVSSVPQPGVDQNPTDPNPNLVDVFGDADNNDENAEYLFRYFRPMQLFAPRNALAITRDTFDETDTATFGAARVLYPWRGKTTLDMSSSVTNRYFDFANSALRSYDPLGAQLFTYAPNYTRNPYRAYQNATSRNDFGYTLAMLERLLRSYDVDAPSLPAQLLKDLGLDGTIYQNQNRELDAARARQALTTLSSDVPAAAVVFPEKYKTNTGNDVQDTRYGDFGFASLVRKAVETELIRAINNKSFDDLADQQVANGVFPTKEEAQAYIRTKIIYDPSGNGLSDALNDKIEEITAYLVAMLPKEIMRGEKIDLNALTQKDYWVDVDYLDDGNPTDLADYYDDRGGDRTTHNLGLVKRMEFARGLYLVIMTLIYEDMNAHDVYGDPDPSLLNDAAVDDDGNTTSEDAHADRDRVSNYIEGSLEDLLGFKRGEQDLLQRELMATRIAQWCVNAVDFADPDATMTPFFFDPTPFDGWWVVWNEDWFTDVYATGASDKAFHLFDPANGDVRLQIEDFFRDAIDGSSETNSGATCFVNANASLSFDSSKRSNQLVAEWMTRKIDKLEDQTTDLGFRLVWGMERPDLVLTETLNWHDLGIADTEFEEKSVVFGGEAKKRGGDDGDPTFDQVRRPRGCSFLELYCTANPNIPQSTELYNYDAADNVWKLRLSKKTPIYTDSLGRLLEMPVWRVAVSDSTDPRGLKQRSGDDSHDQELEEGKDVVYQKSYNSILYRLTPKKTGGGGDDYEDDVRFFSMQPRQFRNLPMASNSSTITNIADLDLDQGLEDDPDVPGGKKIKRPTGYLSDWFEFDIYSSNILGPAVAATYKNAREREVELDRILWFANATGDSVATVDNILGTAGEYPDALRTFCNAKAESLFLKPNQYLFVAPEENCAIGSAAFNGSDTANEKKKFGEDPVGEGTHLNSNLLDARYNGNYVTMTTKANISSTVDRGRNVAFNISEPLWTSVKMDPYYTDSENKITAGAGGSTPEELKINSTVEDKLLQSDGTVRPRSGSIGNSVRDIPFELPPTWWDYETYKNEFHAFGASGAVTDDVDAFKTNRIDNYPLVKDEIFGLGTVPGYKSAFLQRVADPNRPYHPLMNPYITVDWNMMDLTIFTGETMETTQSSIETDNNVAFSDNSDYDDAHDNNWLKLAENVLLGIEKDHTLSYNDAFSSRQWGNAQQKFFNRTPAAARPNPWARAFKKDGANAGLEKPEKFEDHNTVTASTPKIPAFQLTPNHTFGQFNGRGTRFGSWGVNASGEEEFVENTTGIYQNLNESYKGDVVYDGVPRTPYEHLVWNDAPYSNAFELLCVPSSAPGRFGLEFVRHSGSRQYDLSDLYDTTKKTALGSFGVFGFEEWYNDDNAKYNGSNDELKKKGGVVGPYLNFFASSTKPGETLNLGDLMGFVHVPSLYLGTKEVATDLNGNVIFDEYGDPVVHSKRREPGKVNLNSILPSVINSNLSADDFAASLEASPFAAVWAGIGTRPGWTESGSATYSDFEVSREYANDGSYVYFQPSHTHAASWIKTDRSEPDAPSESSLLALNHEMNPDPLFGNIQDVYVTDGDGNLVYEQDADGNLIFEYEYTYTDESGELQTGTTRDPDAIPAGATIVSQYNIPVRSGRHTNIYEATAEMQRLSGVTTDRSNVFAAWVTIGYFEVERCNPGVNMPDKDPDGNNLTVALLQDPNYKWYHYYREIYPDGYTYGRELGSEFGETKRHRGFSIIDRSIPVDFRRGNSVNYQNVILQKRMIE